MPLVPHAPAAILVAWLLMWRVYDFSDLNMFKSLNQGRPLGITGNQDVPWESEIQKNGVSGRELSM